MASRNRMNFASQNNGNYQGYSSFEGGPQQLGAVNPRGLGLGGGGRRTTELSGPRRMLQQAPHYAVMDSRVVSNRSAVGMARSGLMPTSGAEIFVNNHGQHLGGRSHSYSEGGDLVPGGDNQFSSSSLRGPNSSSLYENYGLLPHEQVQLADGPIRTMYPGPEALNRGHSDVGMGLGGRLSGELVGKGGMVSGYHGYMTSEDAKFSLASASQNMQSIGYQGRQIVREGRLVQAVGYGRDDESTFAPPLSPRAMPMSPRRDDIVSMMSPRHDDLSPPMSSRRDPYDNIPRMMSPRRDDLSPPINPRRRDYSDMGMVGRSRKNREEELLRSQDFPMSPRRGAGLSPPMSPRVGWEYEAVTLSPTRLAAPMRPRPLSPPRSPIWRDGAKPPSQWDVLPSKPAVWSGSDREARVGDSRAYGADSIRGAPERLGGGYGAEMDLSRDEFRGLGQGWSMSNKGHGTDGLFVRPEDQDGLLRPPSVSGPGQMGPNFGDQSRGYRATIARPYPYYSVVNQRVGLVTKYIERERAEKVAAERAAKESTDVTNRRYNGHAGNNKPFRTERREKDVSAAVNGSRSVSKSDKNVGGASDRSLSLVAAIEMATKKSSVEKPSEKPIGRKSTNVGSSAAGSSAVGNGNTTQQTTLAVGTPTAPSNTVVGGESPKGPKAEAGKATGDAQKKDTGNARPNGVSSNSANGNSQPILKSGSKPGEPREAPKRPSLVMEIERAKKSRMLAERQRHLREVEETYYDANELSVDFISKVNRSGSRYSRMINDDPYLRRRYQGGQPGLHCLVCGKASNTFSSIYDLLTHAQGSQVQSKRIDHMGFRKALTEILKLNNTNISASNTSIKKEDELILWPPIVFVENTRTSLGEDRCWDGVTNSDMALLLHETRGPCNPIKSLDSTLMSKISSRRYRERERKERSQLTLYLNHSHVPAKLM
ncbi:hypothetical protein MPTK2_4g06220 [Marchantia polymorpha subsp. ruderalis]